MQKHVKKVSWLLALLLMFNVLIYNNASALGENSEYYNNLQVNSSDEEVGAHAIGGRVLVFIGSIVAGYIIDGVLIRYTGQSAGEWISKAITFNKKQPKCQNIYFSSRTGTPICYSGSGRTF